MAISMPEPDRAAVYGRISQDATGEELGVARQLDLGRELIAARGWSLVAEFPDNSISALRGRHRPQYAALLGAIARGEVDVVVVYHLSRLWRNRIERAQGIEALRHARVRIVSVRGPEINLADAYGRSMLGLLGEFDTMESEVKGERIRDQKRQHAAAGRYQGGRNRPFGYALDYDRPAVNPETGAKQGRRVVAVRPHPDEAPIVRKCAARMLAGESLRAVARDLNDRGIVTPSGGEWRTAALSRILASALISGRREWFDRSGPTRPLLGEIVNGAMVAPGTKDTPWPALITVEESDRLRRLLSAPERRTTPRAARKRMLSGILRCALCGARMVSRPRYGQSRYVCTDAPGKASCGKMAVVGALTEDRIRDLVFAKIDLSPDFVERLRRRSGADPDLIDRIRADEQELELLAAEKGSGEISRAEWKAARAPVVARLETARHRLATATHTTALDGFVGPVAEMEARWEAMTDPQRRAVVEAMTESITVYRPSVPGRFDLDRFGIAWREAATASPDPTG